MKTAPAPSGRERRVTCHASHSKNTAIQQHWRFSLHSQALHSHLSNSCLFAAAGLTVLQAFYDRRPCYQCIEHCYLQLQTLLPASESLIGGIVCALIPCSVFRRNANRAVPDRAQNWRTSCSHPLINSVSIVMALSVCSTRLSPLSNGVRTMIHMGKSLTQLHALHNH